VRFMVVEDTNYCCFLRENYLHTQTLWSVLCTFYASILFILPNTNTCLENKQKMVAGEGVAAVREMIFHFVGRTYIKANKWINFNSILEIKYELHRLFFFISIQLYQKTKTNIINNYKL
jgi:hypothetical protein